jgi:hypothetical protein
MTIYHPFGIFTTTVNPNWCSWILTSFRRCPASLLLDRAYHKRLFNEEAFDKPIQRTYLWYELPFPKGSSCSDMCTLAVDGCSCLTPCVECFASVRNALIDPFRLSLSDRYWRPHGSQCRGLWGPEVISRTLAPYLTYDLYPIYNNLFETGCHQRGDDERF